MNGLSNGGANSSARISLDDILNFFFVTQENGSIAGYAENGATLTIDLLDKAVADECYDGIGIDYPAFDRHNLTCPTLGVPKANQGYVWGQDITDDGRIVYGTGANIQCLVAGAFFGAAGFGSAGTETLSYVCEFGESEIARAVPEIGAAGIGDYRPPLALIYDLNETNEFKIRRDLSPKILNSDDAMDADLYFTTLGFRAVGTDNEVIYYAGPSVIGGGINMFAFDAATEDFLGSMNLPEFNNVRRFLFANDALYVGVGNTPMEGMPDAPRGSVLKLTGGAADPFAFEIVANLDSEAANLATFNDKIAVSTWPNAGGVADLANAGLAGIYLSPDLGDDSMLDASDADGWEKVWEVDEYEPDPFIARLYGGGDLAQYGDYLYWGTMHVPGLNFVGWSAAFATVSSRDDRALAPFATLRATAIFNGKLDDAGEFSATPLYAEERLPVYNPVAGQFEWRDTLGGEPTLGRSGFGNIFNNYAWDLEVYRDRLYVGTMDFSYLVVDAIAAALGNPIADILEDVEFDEPLPEDVNRNKFPLVVRPLLRTTPDNARTLGADLYRFDAPGIQARYERVDGLGNLTNYGIRNMTASEYGLFVGTANPLNLLTSGTDGLPNGGYELIHLDAPCLGDTNGDGIVNTADVLVVYQNLGRHHDRGPIKGDVFPPRNPDGYVGLDDFHLITSNLNNDCN